MSDHSPNVAVGPYAESDFTRGTRECPKPQHWTTWDAQGTEREVIEMVAGMIRGHQPEVVLETGTSRGFMTKAIAEALEQNGHGVVHTYEPDADVLQEAHQNWYSADEEMVLPIIPYCQPSMVPWHGGDIDFAWHDSLIPLRVPEFEFYLPHYSERAVVCFHDTAQHFGDWSVNLRRMLAFHGFRSIDWPSPRGVVIARRS